MTVTLTDAASNDLAESHLDRWRLIRINDGNLWLVPDEKNPPRVVQIDEEDVLSVTYIED